MRILTVSDVYYPHPGGVPEHIYHLSIELIKRGHEVLVLAPEMGKYEGTLPDVIRVGKAIPIIANRSSSRVAFSFDIQKRVRDIVRRKFDIVHIHGLVPVLPLLALKYSNSKNVVTVHAAHERNIAYSISKGWLKRYVEKIDARIAVSEVAKKSIFPFFPGDYIIIPNGIDTNRFNPEIEPLKEFEGKFNILFVGRFEQRKGLKYLLSAFPMIVKEVPDARLIIVGSGYLNIPESDNIVVRKSISSSLIPRFYASSDVFCSPAIGNESFGIVLLEAMASGVPLVASSIPGYRCVVRDGETGVLVEKQNPNSIAKAIIKIAKDKDLRNKLSKNGREYALKFSWDKIAERVEEVYMSVQGARIKDEG